VSTLDLSGADLRGFEPIPSGQYNAEIVEVKMEETQGGPNAKLPAGTPRVNVRFRVTDGEFEGRNVFNSYTLPPADYEKAAIMKGMFVRFLIAVGYDEKKVTSGKWTFDADDFPGRSCTVTVAQEPKRGGDGEMINVVKAVKPLGEGASSGGGLL
jgi:hypothetical protein